MVVVEDSEVITFSRRNRKVSLVLFCSRRGMWCGYTESYIYVGYIHIHAD